jgi:F0F1-type ATP synthase epsilon subunit
MADDKAAPATAETDKKGSEEHKTQDGRPTMAIKVYAPFKVYFEGDAVSITAANETGPFDILPRHHNFLCMLVPCDLIVRTPFEEKTIKIARALMHVKAEKVTVFVDV